DDVGARRYRRRPELMAVGSVIADARQHRPKALHHGGHVDHPTAAALSLAVGENYAAGSN
ncbi:MAG: hypothetical protein QOE20_5193, partial [Mycobacterium sp.]|nr:hypothetical protein [Mycobacterium sp.]